MTVFILTLALCFSQAERFPPPTPEEVAEATEKVTEYGKNEVFSLSYMDFADFLLARYYYGPKEYFTYYGCNPEKVDPTLPATVLIHAADSNQGEWMPLLAAMNKENVFTFNFTENREMEDLVRKIHKIRALYLMAGADHVTLHLIGHSLGGIVAAEYGFDETLAVPGTTVEKVITIASRLKNMEPPTSLPLYPYCYPILKRIDLLTDKIEKNRGMLKLYTIAAENDWLLPHECTLLGDEQAVIPSCGHVLVTHDAKTHEKVIEWLY